jgi:hypothetical protein
MTEEQKETTNDPCSSLFVVVVVLTTGFVSLLYSKIFGSSTQQ